jgi:hypothetical protein
MFATNGTSFFVQAKYDGWREAVVTDVCFWHIADIRGTATIWSLLDKSGQRGVLSNKLRTVDFLFFGVGSESAREK